MIDRPWLVVGGVARLGEEWLLLGDSPAREEKIMHGRGPTCSSLSLSHSPHSLLSALAWERQGQTKT